MENIYSELLSQMENLNSEALKPSSAERWINCPKSQFYLKKDFMPYVETHSEAADEGTFAHLVAKKILIQNLCNEYKMYLNPLLIEICDNAPPEMVTHAQKYSEYINKTLCMYKEADQGTIIRIEQRVDASEYAQKCSGIPDAYIVGNKKIFVCDYKYGMIPISVQNNFQLMIYALGAMCIHKELCESVDTIVLSIFQPRAYKKKPIHEWSISKESLIEWGNSILRPASSRALSNLDYLSHGNPGEWCQWCNGQKYCREYHIDKSGFRIEYERFALREIRSYYESVENALKYKNALEHFGHEQPELIYSSSADLKADLSRAIESLKELRDNPIIYHSTKLHKGVSSVPHKIFYHSDTGTKELNSIVDVRRIFLEMIESDNPLSSMTFFSEFGTWIVLPSGKLENMVFGEHTILNAIENITYSIDGEEYVFTRKKTLQEYIKREKTFFKYISSLDRIFNTYQKLKEALIYASETESDSPKKNETDKNNSLSAQQKAKKEIERLTAWKKNKSDAAYILAEIYYEDEDEIVIPSNSFQ